MTKIPNLKHVGINYKPKQVRLLAKHFKRIPVIFDAGDPQAAIQANKLVKDLQFRGKESWIVKIKDDPGAMSIEEAQAFVRELQTWKIK